MITLAAVALSGCLAIHPAADHIVMSDLAAALPQAAAARPDLPVAPAPAPGARRVFHFPELRRLAREAAQGGEPGTEVCIERPLSSPDSAALLAAMRKTMANANIALLTTGHQLLPAGEIEFPADGLHQSGDAAIWSGFVRYAGGRRFALWAKVKVSVPMERVVAAADLAAGKPVTPQQLHVEKRDEFPTGEKALQSVDDVAGRWPRAAIRAGAIIRADQLTSPKEVAVGDVVKVEVYAGAAHLQLEARAEAAGARGEIIPVRNPDSHRRFLARVVGKAHVTVDSSVVQKVNP